MHMESNKNKIKTYSSSPIFTKCTHTQSAHYFNCAFLGFTVLLQLFLLESYD